MIGKIATEKEIIIYRERSRCVTEKVTELLLRSGAFGFWEFQRLLYSQSNPADNRNPCRINPEDLKAVFKRCGVLLAPDEHKAIVLAYSDSVGFVVVEPFFDAVCPLLSLPPAQADALTRVFPVDVTECSTESASTVQGTTSTSGETPGSAAYVLPDVTLNSVLDLCLHLFAPLEEDAGCGEESQRISAALQVCYEEAAVAFTSEHYPKGRVPAADVLNFIAAEMMLNASLRAVLNTLQSRLSEAPRLERAPDPVVRKTKQGKPITNPSGYSMVHTGLRWERLFERYMNEDRRDEWIRGREERPAGSMYMKHACGYAGHLPEFKRHFGRTFHIIEEDLPVLTKPKAKVEECFLRPDRYGPGKELRDNRNAHHYQLS